MMHFKIKAPLMTCLFTGLLLGNSCSRSPAAADASREIRIEATGDSGVEVRIAAQSNGQSIGKTNSPVPVSISFSGNDLEIVCTHAGKPGKLNIRAVTRGNESQANVSEPGSVIQLTLHGDVLEMRNAGEAGVATSSTQL